MTRVICTVGYPASGKSVFKTIAESEGIQTVTMGDHVRTRANVAYDQQYPEGDTAENPSLSEFIGEWATDQRDEHGPEVVAQWVVETIHAEFEEENVVLIDGVRSLKEYRVFQDEFEEAVIVFIDTSFERRLSFIQERGRDGEDTFTADDLQKRDNREDGWGVSETVRHADFCVPNTGKLSEFEQHSRRIIELLQ